MGRRSVDPRARFYVVPIFIVGTYNPDGRPNIAVAAWGGTTSFVPPRFAIYMRPSTQTCRNIVERSAFTVSIPPDTYAREADLVGTHSGKNEDKFELTGLTPVRSDVVDAPYVAEFPVAVECRLVETRETGKHLELVGEVVDIKAEESCVSERGFPDFRRVNPLLFAPEDGFYHALGRLTGEAFHMEHQGEVPGPKEPALFKHSHASKLDDEERLALLSEQMVVDLLQLRDTDDVADLGSGTGFYTNRIAAHTKGTVYAIEIQKEMQQKHAERGAPANVRMVLADALELPLPAGSLDAALSVYALHEMPEDKGIKRVSEVLRPGGRLLIVDWRRAEEAAEHGPPMKARFTRMEVEELLRPYFPKVESGEIDRYLYWVRGTK